MNHMMYADDFLFFHLCYAKYGNIFDITYNANKSYCMVIDNKPQDKKNIHPVVTSH